MRLDLSVCRSKWMVALALIAGLGIYMSVGHTPVAAVVAQEGALVEIELPASLPAEAEAGKEIFNANCAQCHGLNAVGIDGMGPPLIHKIYEPSHHGDLSFYRAVAMGVRAHHWRFGNMPAIEGVSEDQVTQIIAYIRTAQRHNGIQ